MQQTSQISQQPHDAVRLKITQHIQNRQKIKQLYADKGIYTIGKQEKLFYEIQEPNLQPTQNDIYINMKNELSEKGYDEFRFLGQGAQGLVLLAKENSTNRRYAIKGIQIKDQKEQFNQEAYDQVQQEIKMLYQCQGSPYVVNLVGQIEGKQFIFLVLTECLGTLKEIIEQTQNKRLNEISAIKYGKDIAEGLHFIHSKNCLVNDLKMDNILIDYNGNAVVYDQTQCNKNKIADFGFANKLTKQSGYSMEEFKGNIQCQAPECYDEKSFDKYSLEYQKLGITVKKEPSSRSEACSLGYLIYIMITGFSIELLFNKEKPLQYKDDFQNFVYKEQLQYIMDGLTKFIPRERLKIKEVLIILKGIISLEFDLDSKFVEVLNDESDQNYINSLKRDIEFVQGLENKFYPIMQFQYQVKNIIQVSFKSQNEKVFVEELNSEVQVQENNQGAEDLYEKINNLDKHYQDFKSSLQVFLQKDMVIQGSNQKTQELEKINKDLLSKQKDYLKQVEELNKKTKDLDQLNQDLNSQLQQYQKQEAVIEHFNSKIKKLEQRNQELQNHQNQCLRQEEVYQELTKKIINLEKENKQLLSKQQEYSKQDSIIEDLNNQIKALLEKNNEEQKSSSQVCQKNDSIIKNQNQKIQEIEKTNKDLQSKLKDCLKQVDELNKKVIEQGQQNNDLNSKLSQHQKFEALIEDQNNIIKMLEQKNKDLQIQLDKCISYEEAFQEFTKKINHLEKENVNLLSKQQEYSKKDSIIQELNNQIKGLVEKHIEQLEISSQVSLKKDTVIQNQNQKISELEKTNKDLQSKQNDYLKQVEELKKKSIEQDQQNKGLNSKLQQYQKQEELIEDLNNKEKILEQKSKELQTKLENCIGIEEVFQEETKKIKHLEQENQLLLSKQQQYSGKDSTSQELNNKIEELEQKNSQDYQEKLKEMEQVLNIQSKKQMSINKLKHKKENKQF